MPNPVRVFISYSHDSEAHKQQVLDFATKLRTNGVDVELDAWVNGTPEQSWPNWMLDEIEKADFVLVVCTKSYYQRARNKAPKDEGKGVKWEALIGSNLIYHNDSLNRKMVPVLMGEAEIEVIPEWIRGHTLYAINDETHYQKLLRYLINQPEYIKPDLGEAVELPAKQKIISKSYILFAGISVLLLIVMVNLITRQQQPMVTGVVLDENSQPIASATVFYRQDGKMQQIITDSLGYFEFAADSSTPKHMRNVRIFKQGYEQSELRYYLYSNRLQVQLSKTSF